jgi:hypothetical protein
VGFFDKSNCRAPAFAIGSLAGQLLEAKCGRAGDSNATNRCKAMQCKSNKAQAVVEEWIDDSGVSLFVCLHPCHGIQVIVDGTVEHEEDERGAPTLFA